MDSEAGPMQHFKRILVPVLVGMAAASLLVGCPCSVLGKWTTVSTGCLYPNDINPGELVFLSDGTAEWYSPTEDEDEDGPYVFDWTRDGDEITIELVHKDFRHLFSVRFQFWRDYSGSTKIGPNVLPGSNCGLLP